MQAPTLSELCLESESKNAVQDKEPMEEVRMDPSSSPVCEKSLRKTNASKDDFWDALSSHYNYLMDDGLINTCREASSDLSWDDAEEVKEVHCWSFTQFIEHFKRLHDTLHHLQISMQEASEENVLEEQKRVAYLCKHFNEQGQKLSKRYPDMRDEVHRHLNLLNNKWVAVEQSINPNRTQPDKDSAFDEIISQMRCLRKCLRELESKLCPVGFSTKWSLEMLEEKRKEQQILQKEIEAKGKYVSGLLKLCEHLDESDTHGQHLPLRWDPERIRRIADNLQHHWHSIWLQSLECQYVVQTLINQIETGTSETKLDSSFNEGPLKKYPRLSDDWDDSLLCGNDPLIDMSTRPDDEIFSEDFDLNNTTKCLQKNPVLALVKEGRSPTNDKGVMVGTTGITELKAGCNGNIGKFEILQDVGYSSETSAHLSNDEQGDLTNIVLCECDTYAKPVTDQLKDQSLSSLPIINTDSAQNLYLAPDKYPSIHLKRHLYFGEEKPLTDSKFTKAVPGSFYRMTSLDPEVSDDVNQQEMSENTQAQNMEASKTIVADELKIISPATSVSEYNENLGEDFVCSSDISNNANVSDSPSSIQASSNSTLKRTKKIKKDDTTNETAVNRSEKSKRTARVREWLDNCTSEKSSKSCPEKNCLSGKDVIDSSCDASGEYTTESDGEKSAATDDVNNSLSLSQSFAGSVETVVQVVSEEAVANSSQVRNCDLSPNVRLRKKKMDRRDRPWSVIEGNQVSSQPSRFTHSTSEGALNALTYKQEEKSTIRSKKRCLGRERLSLTDMSVSSCPAARTKKLTKISPKYNRHSDGSDGCGISPDKYDFLDRKQKKLDSEKKEESATTHSSDRRSVSSLNSSSSRRRGHHRNRRKNKSSQSDSSTKHKSHSEGSSTEKKSVVKKETMVSNSAKISTTNNNTSCTEDQSSVSDQVWDEYQDPPYLSEPYSEQTADEEQVIKLINFGDDYRAILGSHSDASSVKSVCKAATKSRFKYVPLSLKDSVHHVDTQNPGSDSDSEDFQNMLMTSGRALHFVRNCIKENLAKENFPLSSEFAELVATCQTNVCHLYAIHEELTTKSSSQSFSPEDLQKLQDLIEEWETLQDKLVSLTNQKRDSNYSAGHVKDAFFEVETAMKSYKTHLNSIWNCASEAMSALSCNEDLEKNIIALQNGLATLQEMKGAVLSVSAKVLRLSAEICSEDTSPLRDAAAKLYQQWEDVYELSSSQLTKLQSLQSRWSECTEKVLESDLETPLKFQSSGDGGKLHNPQKNDDQVPTRINKIVPNTVDLGKCSKCKTEISGADLAINNHLPLIENIDRKIRCDKANNTEKHEDNDDIDVIQQTQAVKKESRLRRVFWASMPLHVVLVISFCLSYLLEPQSCENMNNLEFSVFPQLRYYQGQPPV